MTALTLSIQLRDLAELLLKAPDAKVAFTVTVPGTLWPEPPQMLETVRLAMNNDANAWVLDLGVEADDSKPDLPPIESLRGIFKEAKEQKETNE